jgi:tetratricopeptide (TPR) repeat protein
MPGHRSDRTPLAPARSADRLTPVPGAVLSPQATLGDAAADGSIPTSQRADRDRRRMARRGGQRDRYGLPLSTDSPRAAERYVEGLDRLLSWSPGAEASFEQAIAADEGFALAHAALAVIRHLRGDVDRARASTGQARALGAGATRAEQQHIAAVTAEPPRALPLLAEHLTELPHDALALQLMLLLVARSGAADWRQRMLALLDERASAYGDDWWFLGVYALAHEELGRLETARRLAERSLAQNARNAGAAHPLAHVYYETDDHSGGASFLSGWLAGYDRAAPYHCHLSWHLALFALAAGRASRALEVYDRCIRPIVEGAQAGLVDAAGLLWRVQLYADVRQPLPWGEVCRLARSARPGMALADVHAALALAAAGDDVSLNRLIDGLRALAARGHPLAESVTLPLVQGIGAFGRGDYAEAVRWLEPILDQVVRIGGSNAQREVFEETLIVACLRADRFEQAEALLRKRLDARSTARDLVWLRKAQFETAAPEIRPCCPMDSASHIVHSPTRGRSTRASVGTLWMDDTVDQGWKERHRPQRDREIHPARA